MGDISDHHVDMYTSGKWGTPTGKRKEPEKSYVNLKFLGGNTNGQSNVSDTNATETYKGRKRNSWDSIR